MNTPIQYIPSHLISSETAADILSNPNAVQENRDAAKNYYPNYTVNNSDRPLDIEIKGGYNATWFYVTGAVLLAYLILKQQRKV